MNSKPLEYYEENKDKFELKPVYSGFGWFLFTFIGISAMPQRVEFIEKETNETAAVFTDHETRKKYAGR
jgi:hypothetical protein